MRAVRTNGLMGIEELLVDSDHETGTRDESMYWCTVCGMVFELSSPDIDYAWCTRCGAEGVRELPWPTPP